MLSSPSWPLWRIGGGRIDALSLDAAARYTLDAARSGTHATILFRDAHAFLWGRRDAAVRQAEESAALVLPDGMPLVWLLRSVGVRTAERVYGPDLMERVCALSAGTGLRHGFLGGGPGVAERLSDRLQERFPGLTVAGSLAPAVPARPNSAPPDSETLAVLDGWAADILWIGLGTPKQDLWVLANRPRVSVPVMIACGAAFDFLSGTVPQAPRWMQRNGLEWAFRLAQDPHRLTGRYLRTVPAFAAKALWWRLTGDVRHVS